VKTFRSAVREKDLVISAEPQLSSELTAEELRRHIETLRPFVDAIQIGDNRTAEPHMAPLAAASIALSLDIDPVIHLTCRDHNRIALQSILLGAAAIGVSSLVIARGQKIPAQLRGKVKGVFDTQAAQLLQMAERVGSDVAQVSAPGFYIGSYVPVIKPAADWTAAQILEKISAGSRFLQTRPCLNTKLLKAYMERIVEQKLLHRAALIVEVPLLTSATMAREFKNNSPGTLIPEKLIKRIASASDPEAEGITLLAEVLTEIAAIPGISGVNIVYAGSADAVVEVLRTANLTGDR
jgi:methylenetetrahydrofolate reductase (NADPH)